MAKLTRKQQQYVFLGLGLVGVTAVSLLIFQMITPKTQNAFGAPTREAEVDVSIVRDKTSSVGPELSWVNNGLARLEALSETVASTSESMKAQQDAFEARIAESEAKYDEVILQLITKVDTLEKENAELVKQATKPDALNPSLYADTGSEFIQKRGNSVTPIQSGRASQNKNATSSSDEITVQEPVNKFGQDFKLASLESESGSRSAKNTLRDYVPAGSYAPAIVLSGADAATNVSDRENPIPVLFRITGDAVTAGAGMKGARINLKGCTVQGSAVGDISSERVHVRLISMTCINRRGEVLETQVAGYMAGSGKSGVRGQVVSREGGLVTNAAIAGALNGLAGISEKMTGGGEAESVGDLTDMATRAATAAGAGGVQEAATTLSEYYISRAEQYQPVISLYGGTKVELVFLEGISLK
jgi:conjugal transfer pilus assembly protein TraB